MQRIFNRGLRRGRDVPLTEHERQGCFVACPTVNLDRHQFCGGAEFRPYISVPPLLVFSAFFLLNFDFFYSCF